VKLHCFVDDLLKMQYPHFFTEAPPDIYHWLYSFLHKQDYAAFPCIPSVTLRLEHVVMVLSNFFMQFVILLCIMSRL